MRNLRQHCLGTVPRNERDKRQRSHKASSEFFPATEEQQISAVQSEKFKRDWCSGMVMRWTFLLLLLCVASAYAIPDSPAIPGSPPPYTVTLTIDALANSTTTIHYEHDAPTTLTCMLLVNGSQPRTAAVADTQDELVVLKNGTHVANVTCSNSSLSVSSDTIIFQVVNETTLPSVVTIIYPLDIARPDFNLTYKHDAASATCSVSLDGAMLIGRTRTVAKNVQQVEQLLNVALGLHTVSVNCTNSGWTSIASKQVNVTNASISSVVVTPTSGFSGTTITIQGIFLSYTSVKVTIITPTGATFSFNKTTGASGTITAQYTIPLNTVAGTYIISAYDTNQTQNGTFTVIARNATIWLTRTDLTSSMHASVNGDEFYPNDNVTLTLVGGVSWTNTTMTDSDGTFTYTYPPLPAHAYTLYAKSSDGTTNIELDFTVTAAPANTSWTPTNTSPSPPPTPSPAPENSSANNPVENTPPPEETNPTTTPETQSPSPAPVSSWRWLYITLIFIFVIGGVGGYLVYNGTLDVSSVDAFKDSVQSLFSGGLTKKEMKPINPAHTTVAETQTIESFIYAERQKGFDDLTIRSALIAKGWNKNEVDKIFDEVYRTQ